MPIAFAILTSDPNLLACDLRRLKDQVVLSTAERRRAVGMGSYAQDEVLLQRHPPDFAPGSVEELLPAQHSEVLLFHAASLPPSRPLDGSTQPFRFRRWLFCLNGRLNAFEGVRERLSAELPEFLRRHVLGVTEGEAAFALFLKLLRDVGRTDDRSLAPELAAGLLARTARRLQALASEAGAARTSSFSLLATNQRLLLACRSGEAPLFYRPLEGSERCERCGLDRSSPELLLRAHRQQRAVAVATHLAVTRGWVELPPGAALAADANGVLHTVQPMP